LGSSASSFRYQIPVRAKVPTTKTRIPTSNAVTGINTFRPFVLKVTHPLGWFFKAMLNPALFIVSNKIVTKSTAYFPGNGCNKKRSGDAGGGKRVSTVTRLRLGGAIIKNGVD